MLAEAKENIGRLEKFLRPSSLEIQNIRNRKAVLWPLFERLFHEMGHTNFFHFEALEGQEAAMAEMDEECEQIYRDYLLDRFVDQYEFVISPSVIPLEDVSSLFPTSPPYEMGASKAPVENE